MPPDAVDVVALIDEHPITRFQIGVAVLCGLVALLDGYDTQALGYAAPLVAGRLGLSMGAFGPVFSAGLVGATVGALTFGPLADRFGRRGFLIAATLLFAVFTLATVRVASLPELLAYRFMAGLGLGGATPAFLALAAEYAPARLRGTVVTALYAAFPLGGLVGGLTSAALIPRFGWESIFLVGGLAPALVALLLLAALPESLQFLVLRGGRSADARRILTRIAPPGRVGPETALTARVAQRPPGLPIRHLFTQGRAARTLLLWVPFFAAFMILVTVSAWTPTVLQSAGFSLSAGALILSANNVGSVIGNASAGYLTDRFGPYRTLVPAFLLGGLSLAAFGQATGSLGFLVAASAGVGLFVGGGSAGLIALAATTYGTFMRSTGIGWGMGMGRFGQIFGPLAFGVLVARHWTVGGIFYAAALPCLVAAAAVLALRGAGGAPPAETAKR